jgi:hypothetical protein
MDSQFYNFKTSVDWLQVLGAAEIAMWAYFIINLGFFLLNINDLPIFSGSQGAHNNTPSRSMAYLKRAGIGLVVVGFIKVIVAFYTFIIMRSF